MTSKDIIQNKQKALTICKCLFATLNLSKGHKIATLMRYLHKKVEKALDNLRVIGNEAVHPGTIDIKDNANVAFALFRLLNFVVDRMITQLKKIDEIYELLPEGKRKGIEQRNARVTSKQG